MRVYLFEDNHMTREMLTDLLEMLGCNVRSFCDPSEAFNRPGGARWAQSADIVITDLQMPFMSGLELAVKLTGSGFDEKNIAILSGYWTEDNRSFAENLGIRIFEKPLGIDLLCSWIKSHKTW
ncbi:response regulator [Desulfonema ishimotonii]|uniref:Response regulator n=1 Tax=Desulfonema ishimotonii TaxID=45657 RepID=A0A401FQW7_9BACT|nr:response regulator [Desulfonema ishimotonii]GBC59356.1 response regulator [Desulfonema ishimotonii]